jgi:hypothetical protein
MISIDNAVELMIKTYLGLPKRVTGLSIPRKEYQEISENFPALLDALEKYAMDKLDGIELGVIEWYHRLRNELYHQGNGLTVEKDKVEIYAELANLLFKNLFGHELVPRGEIGLELLGEFMAAWLELERFRLVRRVQRGNSPPEVFRISFTPAERQEFEDYRRIRNQVIHGEPGSEALLTRTTIDRMLRLGHQFRIKYGSILQEAEG